MRMIEYQSSFKPGSSLLKVSIFSLLIILCLGSFQYLHAQAARDTVYLSLSEFIKRGIKEADQVKASYDKVRLAQNQVDQAKAKSILPEFNLTTNHALEPGVKSDSLPKNQWYLDPNLENDWAHWSVYTEVDLKALQPLFTWGAIDNAISAARKGAEVARYKFEADTTKIVYRLYQLYYSRVLVMEMEALLDDAQQELNKADKKIKEMQKENNPDLKVSDVYKFRIFKEQFEIKSTEVKQNSQFIKKTWYLVLNSDTSKIYMPKDTYLEPVTTNIRPLGYYQSMAFTNRPELKAINAAEKAAKFGMKAEKARFYPSLFLGFGAQYVHTPRPTYQSPMLGNRFDYMNFVYTFGFRQNLNFWSTKQNLERTKVQYREAQDSKGAIETGIRLDVYNNYKDAQVSKATIEKTKSALHTSNEWLRQEQINYDLGLGEVKDLLDAVKTNLQLEADYRQKVFNYNLNMAKLYDASGMSLQTLKEK